MIGNFTKTFKGIEFEFRTMNVQRLHLFQVYVFHEGKKLRFHIQCKSDGSFYVTDPDKLPQPLKELSNDLAGAVAEYGNSIGAAQVRGAALAASNSNVL